MKAQIAPDLLQQAYPGAWVKRGEDNLANFQLCWKCGGLEVMALQNHADKA
ncbi:MAG: hypothetical protein WAU15_04920 [Nitrosomonas sp.]